MQFIAKIYTTLLSNKTSFPKYIGIAFLADLLPALFLAAIVVSCVYFFNLKYAPLPDSDFSWKTFWLTVIAAPILETYLLIFTLFVLRNWHFKTEGLKLAIVAAILWGLLHGIQSWPWFFVPAWSFFIYSTAYEAWRLKSFKKAYAAAAIPHALNNFFVMLASGFE
jgi:TRAP-type C4-dicarboxylate transport system permease large subunit